jgi:nucleoside transporter
MRLFTRVQLSLMMFLQTFVWGAWYIAAPNYLTTIGFSPTDLGWTYTVGPIAGMISPFFVGLIADRYFSSQRVLGMLNIVAGCIMFGAIAMMKVDHPSPQLINFVLFIYMLAFFPSLALIASLTMRHVVDPRRDFPGIRVFGTIGFMAVSLCLTWLGWETTVNMFYLSAVGAIVHGLYCFTLPDTPPVATGRVSWRQIAGVDAFALLKDRSYLTFLVASTLICIPLAFYQQIASRVVEMVDLPIGQTMSYGQMSEIIFMLIMPLFFVRLGVKWMLAMGMLGWIARYALLALGASSETAWMVVGAIVLHGLCYDFFVVTGQIYTDQRAPKPIRAQAQGMLVLFTLGLGMGAGAQIGGQIESIYTPPESVAYAQQVQARGREIAMIERDLASAPVAAQQALREQVTRLASDKARLRQAELRSKQWAYIFGIPAAFAGIVLMFFLLLFRDRPIRQEDIPVVTPPLPAAP